MKPYKLPGNYRIEADPECYKLVYQAQSKSKAKAPRVEGYYTSLHDALAGWVQRRIRENHTSELPQAIEQAIEDLLSVEESLREGLTVRL